MSDKIITLILFTIVFAVLGMGIGTTINMWSYDIPSGTAMWDQSTKQILTELALWAALIPTWAFTGYILTRDYILKALKVRDS